MADANISSGELIFRDGNKDGTLKLATLAQTCPNTKCKEYSLSASLWKANMSPNGAITSWGAKPLISWELRPQSSARPFPDYIPAVILDDYAEACAIRDLSPKASATLSRRCLQGMIRDFWKVKGNTLFEEINAIAEKIEPDILLAINAVRKIGNIGAHMEKDINLVVDVEPDEAQLLIGLIEVLMEEWYIARKNRADHLASIVALAAAKKP